MEKTGESLHPAREVEAKAYHERRKKKSEPVLRQAESFHLVEGKVVKKTKTERGTHSVFHCTRKEADARGLKYEK